MNNPPKIPLRFLRWFCREDFIDEIEGDLIELFEMRAQSNLKKARYRFAWDILRSFRWINIKKSKYSNSTAMFSNYFKIGYRNLVKDFRFSVINITGLAIGLSVFITMIMMVNHEYSFDKFHSKADRIYQVIQDFQLHDGPDPEIHTSTQLAKALREDLPNVESAVTITGAASTWATTDDKRFFEEEGIVAWPEFFQIFDFEFAKGNKNALKPARSIVLTEALATKYYGFENPIGKTVNLEYYGDFTVTAVLKDIPSNSYIQFEYLITPDLDIYFENTAPWFSRWFPSWRGNAATTYVLLDENNNQAQFESQIEPLLEKYLGTDDPINSHYLIGLLDLHFGSNGIDGRVNKYVKGDLQKIKLFTIIAIVILAMACFNYINITTARSIRRTKEVGIRKSIGAIKSQITWQFLTESFLLVFVSVLLSVILIFFVLPYFNLVTGIDLRLNTETILPVVPYVIATILLVTVLAGFYPALYLSKFSAIKVLKNSTINSKGNNWLRNGLVTIQYASVIIILAALFIVNQQYNYMSSKSLGFKTDQLMIVEINSGGVRNNYNTIKNELEKSSHIKNVTGLTRMIGGSRSPVTISVADFELPDETTTMKFYGMDSNGPEVLSFEILAGSGFTGTKGLDSTSVLINETAASKFGGLNAVGKWVVLNSDDNENFKAQIKGVAKDFHLESMHEPIKPTIIGYYKNPFMSLDDIVIEIDGNNVQGAIAVVEKIHNRYDKNGVMDWRFMDEMIQEAYEDEAMFQKVFTGASMVSLIIAFLGVIGLISYNVIARTKEFGIRKILGAKFQQILMLQGKSFVWNLAISSLIAIPIAVFLASNWLSNYAFRISLNAIPFLLVIVIVSLITVLTVVFIGHKVARSNPSESLRYE
ncbi:MAG: ABC transporter permease [bacterium]|nr:ABC transporter permease [bacterium]